ncbi:methionine gamma-lyase [Klebsormidium nitens]|uniref:Methionine gamma-lyase n=1 Tax=Klebsormidium nitens TaxID=105231 RepID=A0A1Y1I6T4_KLENI|nr:methionine gamma-lyase [Klebsormidium nitens]|eukprot:GAQ84446.1 methionine gamma-lyase [Klebsormidium nitens]
MSGEPTPKEEGPQRQGLSLATLATHAGIPRKPLLAGGQDSAQKKSHTLPQNAHVTPLFQTTVFDFDSVQTAADQVLRQGAYEYGRVGLPNPHELGAAVAALEGADEGVATSTGMGAISAALLSHLRSGDPVIAQYNGFPSP